MRTPSTALVGALLAAPALLAASPAPAAPTHKAATASAPSAGGVTGDVRCLMTMMALGQDKARQQAGQIGVYFFAGRISARGAANLGAAMKAEAASLDRKALEQEARRCGPMITAGTQNVQAGLNSLRLAGAPPPAAPPAAAPPLATPPAAPPPH